VALSADGNTAIVGGPGDNDLGAAWVFTRTGSLWTQQGNKLRGTGATKSPLDAGDGQGHSVALSADGNTAILGGPWDGSTGATWVFTRSGDRWVQQGSKLVGSNENRGYIGVGRLDIGLQGMSVGLSADGNTAIVGGPHDNDAAGAAWVFTRKDGV
jgi:lipocalin